jgi:ceramidase
VQPANQIPVRLSRLLLLVVGGALIAALAVPRVAQDPAYHQFADTRPLLGIPNGLNVLSNVPFAMVGLAGLVAVARMGAWERWPYAALFAGVALTSVGSAYYHFAPDNWTLVWDRLPMTVGFMGLLTAVLSERVSHRLARALFVPLLVFGAASVVYWYWSEVRGVGDLRPYALVQFGSLVVILMALLGSPSRHGDDRFLYWALGAYLLAKVFESADAAIFEAGRIVSGHTVKHVVAAAALWFIVVMIHIRARLSVRSADARVRWN